MAFDRTKLFDGSKKNLKSFDYRSSDDETTVLANDYFKELYEDGAIGDLDGILVTVPSGDTFWIKVFYSDGVVLSRKTSALEAGAGDVNGPASSTDNGVALFDGTTGKLLESPSDAIITNGQLNIPNVVATTAVRTPNITLDRSIADDSGQITIKPSDGPAYIKDHVGLAFAPDGKSCIGLPAMDTDALQNDLEESDSEPVDGGLVYDNLRGTMAVYDRVRTRWMSYKTELVTMYTTDDATIIPLSSPPSDYVITTLTTPAVDPNADGNEGVAPNVGVGGINVEQNHVYMITYTMNFFCTSVCQLRFGILYTPTPPAPPFGLIPSLFEEIGISSAATDMRSVTGGSCFFVPIGGAAPGVIHPSVTFLSGTPPSTNLTIKHATLTVTRMS